MHVAGVAQGVAVTGWQTRSPSKDAYAGTCCHSPSMLAYSVKAGAK